MAKVYLETSFISYLASKPSRDLIVAGHQRVTQDWWETRRAQFELFISQRVIDEAGAGDSQAAMKRLGVLAEIPLLDANEDVETLMIAFLASQVFPAKAADDAFHVAIASIHEIDYLMTWNCRHIANAQIRPLMAEICHAHGYSLPEICTPPELMGEDYVAQ